MVLELKVVQLVTVVWIVVVEAGEVAEEVDEIWTTLGRYAALTSATAMTTATITALGINPIVCSERCCGLLVLVFRTRLWNPSTGRTAIPEAEHATFQHTRAVTLSSPKASP
jgi:preprotein translocase subunit SecY